MGVEVIPEVTGNIGGSIGKDSLVAKKRYQMHLKSLEGQIYVLLVNKDSDNEQPLVVQVSSWSTLNYWIYFKFTLTSDYGSTVNSFGFSVNAPLYSFVRSFISAFNLPSFFN